MDLLYFQTEFRVESPVNERISHEAWKEFLATLNLTLGWVLVLLNPTATSQSQVLCKNDNYSFTCSIEQDLVS